LSQNFSVTKQALTKASRATAADGLIDLAYALHDSRIPRSRRKSPFLLRLSSSAAPLLPADPAPLAFLPQLLRGIAVGSAREQIEAVQDELDVR